MKKPSRLIRCSAPGDFAFTSPSTQRTQKQQRPWGVKCWLAVLGAAVLVVLLLAQVWLISDGTSSTPSRHASTIISLSSSRRIGTDPGGVDAGHLALLDTLWAALPFTHVVKAHQQGPAHRSYGFLRHTAHVSPILQQQQPQRGNAASGVSESPPTPSSSSSSRTQKQLPELRLPSNQELSLLHRLAAAALSSGLTAEAARHAYVAAFQAVSPPRGFPAWQVRLPPNPEAAAAAEAAQQQRQHKGAQYISVGEADSKGVHNITAAELLKLRPKGRTLNDEAAVAAVAAAATAFLARTSLSPEPQQQQQQQQPQQQQQQQQQDAASRQGQEAAGHLLQYALSLIKAGHRLAPCATDDASLPIDKLMGVPNAPRVLLAITGAAEGASALPNLVLQLLQFVLQSNPDSLYISFVDDTTAAASNSSSSSSTGAAYYLDMLQLLLAPLQVPLLVVQDSRLQHIRTEEGTNPRAVHAAAARNAAVELFFRPSSGARDAVSCPAASRRADYQVPGGSSEAAANAGSSSSSPAGATIAVQAGLSDDGSSSSSGDDSDGGLWQALWHRPSTGRALLNRGSFGFGFLPSRAHAQQPAADADVQGPGREQSQQEDPIAAAIAAATARSSTSSSSAGRTRAQQNVDPSSAFARSQQHNARPKCFNPDWVVFIQASSFFCKSDLQRSLMHTDADLTCGLDLHVAEPSPIPQGQATAAAAAVAAVKASAAAGDTSGAAVSAQVFRRQLLQQQQQQQQQRVRSLQARDTPFTESGAAATAAVAADAWHERPQALDVWKHPVVFAGAGVSRLVNGQPFSAAPYFAGAHAPTLRRLVAGLPVQVYSCWSGLTKLSASPLKRGLRFRAKAMLGECSSSSSEGLFCDDLHRTGFTKAVIDAGIVLTHDLDVSVKFTQLIKAADRAPYLRRSRWVEVQGSGHPWEVQGAGWQQVYQSLQCCKEPQPHAPKQQQDEEDEQQQQRDVEDETGRLLVVDEMVAAVAASSRPGPPLPLRDWDVSGCEPVDVWAHNFTGKYLSNSHW